MALAGSSESRMRPRHIYSHDQQHLRTNTFRLMASTTDAAEEDRRAGGTELVMRVT